MLPAAVTKLMTLDRSRRDYFDRVLALIEAEPNFAARILATANSASSAPLVPVTTLATAIARLGGATSANLVLAASVTHVFVPQDDWEKSLWRHAIQVAVTALALATRSSDNAVDPQEAYACGLLHDIGRFILLQEAPDELREIDEGSWDAPDALIRKELSICGVTHAELGALACEKWGIPYLIEEVVRNHHQIDPASAITPAGKLTAIIRVADFAMFPVALPGAPGIAEVDDATLQAPNSPITTLSGAIARLGAGGASRLVITISITRLFVPRDDWEKSLWRHAIQVALTTRALAESSNDPEIDPSEAYVCGLLHDVGRFVMFQEAPDQLRQIDEGDWDTPEKLVSQELAICGITHAELGALACAKWGLPASIEQMVRHHHRSDPALAGTAPDKLAALVRVADLAMFPSAMPGTPGLAEANDSSIVHLAGRLPPSIGLTMAELRELIVATTDAAEATCIELGVS